MSRKIFLSFLFIFISSNLFCFEFKPFYSSVSFEINMNSYENVSFGTNLEAFYSFSPTWKVGASLGFSSDFIKFNSSETLFHGGYLFPFSFGRNMRNFIQVLLLVMNKYGRTRNVSIHFLQVLKESYLLIV